jgi:predicted nucleic acid-binding protein
MTARTFVDSNVPIYAHDADAGFRQRRAAEELAELWTAGLGLLSKQVLQEFYVNVTKKIKSPLTPSEAREVVARLCLLGRISDHSGHRSKSFRDRRNLEALVLGWDDSGCRGAESRCPVAYARPKPRI